MWLAFAGVGAGGGTFQKQQALDGVETPSIAYREVIVLLLHVLAQKKIPLQGCLDEHNIPGHRQQ